ncbi:MAG: hypothetical protein A2Y33_05910 [Spirochaetes bacterium GWF1_51_8]|nr:MAG: hypothetical protein A2Y33_05910 [Spirochaetes bacterium GWF1_51_8]
MGTIFLKNICLTFGDHMLFDNLSERIEDGETYVLLGYSGSGKSTLLKTISGLLFPNKGEVIIGGKNIFSYTKSEMLNLHKHSGFVFQNAALISNLSIFENLALFYQYHYGWKDDAVMERIQPHLDSVGWDDDLSLRPGTLSTGERILVSIIRAISHDPEFVFWDEPSANLDNLTMKKANEIFLKLKKQGKTMILVTNDIRFGLPLADKIGILHQGKIIESGRPADLKKSDNEVTRSLLS